MTCGQPFGQAPPVGFIWLYFFLSGGVYRKRALQTLALVALPRLPTGLWVTHITPHCMPKLRATLSSASAHRGPDDLGPASSGGHGIGMMINLQTILSLIRDDPRFYNQVTHFLCGVLLLAWSLKTLRLRATPTNAWLTLAFVAFFSLFRVYHRQGDARLLLPTVPACTMLWAEGGRIAQSALLVIAAGFALTGDITWAIILGIINNLYLTMTRQAGANTYRHTGLARSAYPAGDGHFLSMGQNAVRANPSVPQKDEIANAGPAVQIKTKEPQHDDGFHFGTLTPESLLCRRVQATCEFRRSAQGTRSRPLQLFRSPIYFCARI